MAAAIYSTTNQEGIDINLVTYLDTKSFPEYPAPPFLPGTKAWGTDGSEWVYCTASLTISAGSVVLVTAAPGSWSVAPVGGFAVSATSPFGQLLGVVSGSNGLMFVGAPSGTQTGTFFWVQRAGNTQGIRTTPSTTKNAQLYSTSTLAGALSSTAGGVNTTFQVNGIAISLNTGSLAGPNTAVLNYPVVAASA